MVGEVERAVQEAGVGHGAQLDEFHGLQVEHHGVLCAGAVVVAAEDNNLIARNKRSRLRLDRQRKLDRQDRPLIIRHIILLNGVNASAALVAAEDIDIGVLKHNSRHGAPPLVQIRDALPPIHIDGVSLAALKHAIDRSAADGVHEIALVS